VNERIKELLVKAIKEVGPDDDDNGAKEKTLEKFAELLLLECIELVETTPRHCAFTTYDLGTVECTIQKTSERLHEHFGMKRTYKTTDERTGIKEILNTRRSL
jgi:hypothetical protein